MYVYPSYFLYMVWMLLQQLFECFKSVNQSLGVIKAVNTQHNFLVCEHHLQNHNIKLIMYRIYTWEKS